MQLLLKIETGLILLPVNVANQIKSTGCFEKGGQWWEVVLFCSRGTEPQKGRCGPAHRLNHYEESPVANIDLVAASSPLPLPGVRTEPNYCSAFRVMYGGGWADDASMSGKNKGCNMPHPLPLPPPPPPTIALLFFGSLVGVRVRYGSNYRDVWGTGEQICFRSFQVDPLHNWSVYMERLPQQN